LNNWKKKLIRRNKTLAIVEQTMNSIRIGTHFLKKEQNFSDCGTNNEINQNN
jgi:hypothetical protein